MHTFYEAVGLMISAQSEHTAQEHLIEKYMSLPNQVWDSIITQATQVCDKGFSSSVVLRNKSSFGPLAVQNIAVAMQCAPRHISYLKEICMIFPVSTCIVCLSRMWKC